MEDTESTQHGTPTEAKVGEIGDDSQNAAGRQKTPRSKSSSGKRSKSHSERRKGAGRTGNDHGTPVQHQPTGGPPQQNRPGPGPHVHLQPVGMVPAVMGAMVAAPLGLHCLAALDHIVVQQQIEMLEVMIGFETANRYCLTTGQNQLIFYAVEESTILERQFSGKSRSLCMHVLDMTGVEIVRCFRPSLGCCDDRLMVVECPPGAMVAGVMRRTSCCGCISSYEVCDGASQPTLHIKKEGSCCGTSTFSIYAINGALVGSIVKKFGGFMKEMMTDADTFVVTWPVDIPVQIKAALIGATFLIDFQEFEK